jgi:hypothetical protein
MTTYSFKQISSVSTCAISGSCPVSPPVTVELVVSVPDGTVSAGWSIRQWFHPGEQRQKLDLGPIDSLSIRGPAMDIAADAKRNDFGWLPLNHVYAWAIDLRGTATGISGFLRYSGIRSGVTAVLKPAPSLTTLTFLTENGLGFNCVRPPGCTFSGTMEVDYKQVA